MRYQILDLELSRPLPDVALSQGEGGVALLVRREGRPVAFVMKKLRAGTALTPGELAQLIADKTAPEIIAAAIADELRGERGEQDDLGLTIAVCTHDRTDDLRACLESLLAIRRESDELLVVDNAPSDDRTRALVESLDNVRYVCESKPGLDFARNRALHEASGRYVAFLDDDVVVDAAWTAGLREAVADQPDAAVITGLVLPYELQTLAQILFERRGGFRRGFRTLRYAGERYPDNPLYPLGAGVFGAGANMVVRKDVALELGGFDEALDTGASLPGGGDIDIFYRVLRAGHALAYEPRMLAFHKHRRSYRRMLRQYRSWGTGFAAFLQKTEANDPTVAARVRQMRRWWLRYQVRELVRGVRRRGPALPDQVLAELMGALAASTGAYSRSQRRTDRARKAVA